MSKACSTRSLHDELVGMSACSEAVKWVGRQSLATAWEKCERADWMLWYAYRRGVDPRILTRAACACARTALQYVPTAEDRPRLAIEAAEAWADNPTAAWAAWAAAQSAAATAAAWSAAAAHRDMANLVRGIITAKMLDAPR